MLEREVESALKVGLENYGFKCLKLVTPGTSGTPDRLILRPKWSPGQPWVLEVKRPGKAERALQGAVRDDWRARGVRVLDMCDTIEKVRLTCLRLRRACESTYFLDNLPWKRVTELELTDAAILAGVD